MKHFLIMGFIIIFLLGCCERKKIRGVSEFEAEHMIDINRSISATLDDIIIDIDTIRLEATKESLIKYINQLQIIDDQLLILTNNNTVILFFDSKGKYITQINDRGQGPNEYLTISGFWIDPINKRIIISDNFSKKILIYNLYGVQIKVINLNFHPIFILPYTNGFICNSSGYFFNRNPRMDDYHINFLDSNGVFIKSALEQENKNSVAIQSHGRINILKDGDVLFQPPLSYTIYKIHNYNIIPYYGFNNLSEFKLLSKKEYKDFRFKVEGKNTLKEKEDNGYLLTWGDVYESNNYVFFLFKGYDICRLLLYDKKSLKSLLIDPVKLKGDVNTINFFLHDVCAVSDDRIFVSPSSYIVNKINGDIKIYDNKVKQFLDNTDIDSNQLLISFKIKFPEK